MTDIEYAKRLERIMEECKDKEEMLNAIDFLKHCYIVEKEMEDKKNVR